jgi:hypothetical protein
VGSGSHPQSPRQSAAVCKALEININSTAGLTYQYSGCTVIVIFAGAENRTYKKIHCIFRATKSPDSSHYICPFSYDLQSTGAKQASQSNDTILIWIPCQVFCPFLDKPMMPPLVASIEIMLIYLCMLHS